MMNGWHANQGVIPAIAPTALGNNSPVASMATARTTDEGEDKRKDTDNTASRVLVVHSFKVVVTSQQGEPNSPARLWFWRRWIPNNNATSFMGVSTAAPYFLLARSTYCCSQRVSRQTTGRVGFRSPGQAVTGQACFYSTGQFGNTIQGFQATRSTG